jgi:hypothetical protein
MYAAASNAIAKQVSTPERHDPNREAISLESTGITARHLTLGCNAFAVVDSRNPPDGAIKKLPVPEDTSSRRLRAIR